MVQLEISPGGEEAYIPCVFQERRKFVDANKFVAHLKLVAKQAHWYDLIFTRVVVPTNSSYVDVPVVYLINSIQLCT